MLRVLASMLILSGAGLVASPSGTNAAASSASGTVSTRLVVDTNGNRVFDDEDGALTIQTGIDLVAWDLIPDEKLPRPEQPADAPNVSDPPPVVNFPVLTDRSGGFTYANLPEGTYNLRVWWAGGFALGGARNSPDLWRAIFHVGADGELSAPESLPDFWPGTYGQVRLDVAADNVWLGAPPEVLLVLPKDPNVVPYPIDSGTVGEPAQGYLDVGRAMRAALPSTGSGGSGAASWWPAAGLALAGAAAIGFAWRQRRA